MEEKLDGSEGKLRRELGLSSVVFFIFGYVVGAGILIQTGVTAGITGPMLWLAFIIAGIPNIIGAIIICYVVSAFPVSGGAWVYSSRLGTPLIGFIVLSSIVLHIMGALALLAIGFGTYFENFIPGTMLLTGIVVILVFYIINVLGVKVAGWVQVVLAIFGDFLVIMIFIIFGLPNIDIEKIANPTGGLLPNGIMGIFMGAIILSFSYAGFAAIIEIGGEIKNPRKNIPLGLILSFLLILVVYILVSFIMVGSMDWQSLGEGATLVDVASTFFPGWFIIIMNILILIAIGSTIHGVLLAYSRDLFAAARDKVVPSFLGKVNKKNVPQWSLTFFTIGAIIVLFFQSSIIDLSVLCNFTITIPNLVLAYIPFKLEKKYPELIEKSNFPIKKRTLMIILVINIGYSIFAIIIMIALSPAVVLFAAIFYAIAICYFFIKKQALKKKGIDINEICATIPDEVLDA